MSEEVSFWAKMAEKLIGIILVALSIMMIYFTATSADVLKAFTGFFGFLSAVILIIGVFLIVVKIPE